MGDKGELGLIKDGLCGIFVSTLCLEEVRFNAMLREATCLLALMLQ